MGQDALCSTFGRPPIEILSQFRRKPRVGGLLEASEVVYLVVPHIRECLGAKGGAGPPTRNRAQPDAPCGTQDHDSCRLDQRGTPTSPRKRSTRLELASLGWLRGVPHIEQEGITAADELVCLLRRDFADFIVRTREHFLK